MVDSQVRVKTQVQVSTKVELSSAKKGKKKKGKRKKRAVVEPPPTNESPTQKLTVVKSSDIQTPKFPHRESATNVGYFNAA